MKRMSLSPMSSLRSEQQENVETQESNAALAQYLENIKVWFHDTCTSKLGLMSSFVKNSKSKEVFIIPGKIGFAKGDQISTIDIEPSLRLIQRNEEVVFEYYSSESPKMITKTYIFNSKSIATSFTSTINEERERVYIQSENFDEHFGKELNTKIREIIIAGNTALRDMYLACFNQHTPAGVIKALYSNYRIMVGGKGTADSFAALLSAVANDPVMLILFLCCKIDLNQAMLAAVDAARTDVDDNKCNLLNPFLTSLTATITAEAWQHKRELLLAQFRFPTVAPGSSGLTTPEVLHWAQDFTVNYPKLFVNGHVMHHLLEDEKYLCYTFLHHHAVSGDRFVELVQQVFAGVPKAYLFASFNADESPSNGHRSPMQATFRQSCRHHFVDFLFNPNLSARSVFQTLLTAFKDSNGYDDLFFEMFLAEAISKDCPRVAVDVLTRILFTERGEPSLRALQSCGRIPVIIFKALVAGILNPSANGRPVSDDMRLLLEIAIRFEDFACNSDLSYLTTIGRLFAEEPTSIQKFSALVDAMKFLPFVLELCGHNIPEYVTMVGEQQERADQEMMHQSKRGLTTGSTSAYSSFRTSTPPPATATAHLAEVSMEASAEASEAVMKESGDPSAPPALPEASIFVGEAEVVMSESFYSASLNSADTRQQAQPQTSAVSGWKDRSVENLSALVYGFVTLVISSGALPNPTEAAAPQNETLAAFLSAVPSSFFSVLLQPGAEMRARLIVFLKSCFHILNPYDHLLASPLLLCNAEQFSYSFLHALSYKPRYLSNIAVILITVAVKLKQYKDLWACLHHIDGSVGLSADLLEQMQTVLNSVKTRDDTELQAANITLQTLAGYAEVLAKALQGKRSRSERDAVLSAADELLLQTPVNTWEAGFQNL